jgi:hypothetical protein
MRLFLSWNCAYMVTLDDGFYFLFLRQVVLDLEVGLLFFEILTCSL